MNKDLNSTSCMYFFIYKQKYSNNIYCLSKRYVIYFFAMLGKLLPVTPPQKDVNN